MRLTARHCTKAVLRAGVSVLSTVTVSAAALACSTVAFQQLERPLLAYNFDFDTTGTGFLMVNPAGATKRSVMSEDRPAEWTARFGSVTFNQIGPTMPAAGMNTAGLAVTLMWTDDAVFGGGNGTSIVSELEFIQRLLDTSASVDEALAAIGDVRIEGFVPIHYFLFDRSGTAASVLPGESGYVVHTGDDLPVPALTNTRYDVLIEEAAAFAGLGGAQPVPAGTPWDGTSSLSRFVIAASAIAEADEATTTDQAFAVLDEIANPSTRWQVVFDPADRRIAFRTERGVAERVVSMDDLDMGCVRRPLSLDLSALPPGDLIAALAPIDHDALVASMSEVFLSLKATAAFGRPEVVGELAAGLVGSISCDP